MIKVDKSIGNDTTTFKVEGEINTLSSDYLRDELNGVTTKNTVIDLKDITYITSAGLRIFIEHSNKKTAEGGVLTISNVNKEINELFKVTGLDHILNIELIK